MLNDLEWEKLNRIINNIYKQKNILNVRRQFLKDIGTLIDFSLADFSMGMASANGHYRLTDPVVSSSYDKFFEAEFLKKYEQEYYRFDYVNWLFNSKESLVYRESDLIAEKMRRLSPFYQGYLLPSGLIYIAGMIICGEEGFVAALTFHNSEKKGDFSDKSIYIMEQLLPHLQQKFEALRLAGGDEVEDLSYELKHTYHLTARESQIAKLICSGMTNVEIAEALKIKEDTVKKHIYNMFQKLEIKNRSKLAMIVMENGLVDTNINF